MIKIAAWNVRGLNKSSRQGEVRKLMLENQLSMVGVLETKVRSVNKNRIVQNLFQQWSYFDNYSSHFFW